MDYALKVKNAIAESEGFSFRVGNQTQFRTGTNHIVNTASIDAYGGTIEAGNTGSPVDGVKVVFPPGALPSALNVSIGYNDGGLEQGTNNFSTADVATAQKLLYINVPVVYQFDQPVQVTVPFADDGNNVPAPYYVDNNGNSTPCPVNKY